MYWIKNCCIRRSLLLIFLCLKTNIISACCTLQTTAQLSLYGLFFKENVVGYYIFLTVCQWCSESHIGQLQLIFETCLLNIPTVLSIKDLSFFLVTYCAVYALNDQDDPPCSKEERNDGFDQQISSWLLLLCTFVGQSGLVH